MLDMLFKPGVQVRILAGSVDQASNMFRYLTDMARRPALRGVLARKPTPTRVELVNGSAVQVLSATSRAVRGQRVHKMRCDEVDEFEPAMWRAAALTTRSQRLGGVQVRGVIEAISTAHKPAGMMTRLIERSKLVSGVRVLRWNALDVAERCPPARPCESCLIKDDCRGIAKHADGFVSIDDLVSAWRRSSNPMWGSEMLCRRPVQDHPVYPSFDPTIGGRHVMPVGPGGGGAVLAAGLDARHSYFWEERAIHWHARHIQPEPDDELLVAGMDFGLRNPFVMLWARLRPPADEADRGRATLWNVDVVDEYVAHGRTMDENLRRVERCGWPRPMWIGADPTGDQRNRHSGLTDIRLLRKRGYSVLHVRTQVVVGIEIIRRRLDRGTLRIDPRCVHLIEAMRMYHYDEKNPNSENPVKDGPDNACDALRYLLVNLETAWSPVQVRDWMHT
jgi:hypothetical protein